jgi:hypothetical protein
MSETDTKKSNPELILKDVRLSFAENILEPEQGPTRDKGKHKGKIPFRWHFNALVEKERQAALIEQIKVKMREARDQQWPKDPPKIKNDKLCLRDGDEEEWAGYAGNMYLSVSRSLNVKPDENGVAKAPKRPYSVVGPRKVKDDNGELRFPEAQPGDPYAPYSGCYVNLIVRFWAQDDVDYGKRINASIEGVQFARHGEAFGGGRRVDVNSTFDDMETEGGAFDDKSEESTSKSEDSDSLL